MQQQDPQRIAQKCDEVQTALTKHNLTAPKSVSLLKVISTLSVNISKSFGSFKHILCRDEEVLGHVKGHVKKDAKGLAKVDNEKAKPEKQKMTEGVILEMVENNVIIAVFILSNPVSKDFASKIGLKLMHKRRTKGVKSITVAEPVTDKQSKEVLQEA